MHEWYFLDGESTHRGQLSVRPSALHGYGLYTLEPSRPKPDVTHVRRHPPCPSRVYIPNIHPSFPNTCISCVKRQYPSRTLKLSHIELCQYCRGGPDGKPGSCIPFSFFIHSTMDQMDTPPDPPPRIGRCSTHARILFVHYAESIDRGRKYVQT